ncbi:MAG: ATP-binding cassette domain-containing protein [Bacilli bacterium]|nr:ATP-binding cassette domain-containing protein [Bacilli bacterium]
MREYLKELFVIIKNFIKPTYIQDKMLNLPKEVKKIGIKLEVLSLSMTVITLGFSFLLKLTNNLISLKYILLGIIIFMLYRSQQIIQGAFNIYETSERTKFNLIFDDELVYRGSIIVGKVKDKILKYDDKSKMYKIMTNEEVLNSIKNYLNNYWNLKLKRIFNIFEAISIIAMIVVAIVTNDALPNNIFIILILFFVILNFFVTTYININRKSFYKKHREFDDKQSIIKNDLLRVPFIVEEDLNMRINKLQDALKDSNKNLKSFYKKMDISRFLISLVESFCEYGLIIFFVLNIQLENITLGSIAEITATLVIIENALWHVKRLGWKLDYNNEMVTKLQKETDDINLILDTYYKVQNDEQKKKIVDTINIKPFEIKYLQESNNDVPFTLVSNKDINISKGDVAFLYGSSGSGKSTFMKMLTERISLEKNIEIPSTNRYLFYDEKLKFGSLSLYEELFSGTKPNLKKMEDILKNLHLWYEIDAISKDVWQFMKEKKFELYLSNGQKQRLILAKILYFLNDEIDAIILDEPTSGLDNENRTDIDAQNVLEYIINFVNKDKKRIVVISTHQNLDNLKKNIKKDYIIKDFKFINDKEKSIIREV